MRVQGIVEWFSDAKGFGFIVPDDPRPNGENVFVHYTGILGKGYRTLDQDQRVEFEIVIDDKGTGRGRDKAVNVTLVT